MPLITLGGLWRISSLSRKIELIMVARDNSLEARIAACPSAPPFWSPRRRRPRLPLGRLPIQVHKGILLPGKV